MITESQGSSIVQSRLQVLERELEKTRTKLTETEYLLSAATRPGQPVVEPPAQPTLQMPEITAPVTLVPPPLDAVAPAAEIPAEERRTGLERREIQALPANPQDERRLIPERRKASAKNVKKAAPVAQTPPVTPLAPLPTRSGRSPTKPSRSPTEPSLLPIVPRRRCRADRPGHRSDHRPDLRARVHSGAGPGFRDRRQSIPTICLPSTSMRYRPLSASTTRARSPTASATCAAAWANPRPTSPGFPDPIPRPFVTICWDIVWYQYLVDLRRDLPSSAERVTLHREGMDLDELAFYFSEKNAVVNDDGRLDASELEVRLLSDPSALITEMDDAKRRS